MVALAGMQMMNDSRRDPSAAPIADGIWRESVVMSIQPSEISSKRPGSWLELLNVRRDLLTERAAGAKAEKEKIPPFLC